ncbi:FecR family protein [Chitinophaga solisilvae]|uniref:FecR family protein n=1 Tax=Chitinophaga solisilvae TaxID=1233460 RepID=UPI00136B6F5B|nr:FecR domain-containing protein [Chitinophaga solisilvae]
MKKIDITSIYELMIARQTGIISEEESRHLDRLIQDNPDVKILWEKMQQAHSTETVAARFAQYDREWTDASDITAVPFRRKTSAFARISAVAATVLLACAAIYFLVKQPAATPAAVAGNKKAILLQTAGGETIDLSALQQDTFSVSGAHFSRNNKSLRFDVTADEADTRTMNTLTVPVGADYHIVLADKSEIWLNSATTLQFPFSFRQGRREITINGEAYMKINGSADAPFIVHTPQGEVRVLGTEFNVNSYDSATTRVALVKGAVQFSGNDGQAITLRPGREVVYRTDRKADVQPFDEDLLLSWRKGHYTFNDATLQDITAVLPRWFGITVVMDNPALTHAKFTGIMNRNAPITSFLDNIRFTMKIDYYFDKEGILHFK